MRMRLQHNEVGFALGSRRAQALRSCCGAPINPPLRDTTTRHQASSRCRPDDRNGELLTGGKQEIGRLRMLRQKVKGVNGVKRGKRIKGNSGHIPRQRMATTKKTLIETVIVTEKTRQRSLQYDWYFIIWVRSVVAHSAVVMITTPTGRNVTAGDEQG